MLDGMSPRTVLVARRYLDLARLSSALCQGTEPLLQR